MNHELQRCMRGGRSCSPPSCKEIHLMGERCFETMLLCSECYRILFDLPDGKLAAPTNLKSSCTMTADRDNALWGQYYFACIQCKGSKVARVMANST